MPILHLSDEDRVHFGRPGFGRGEDGLGVPGVGFVEGGAEGEGGHGGVPFWDEDYADFLNTKVTKEARRKNPFSCVHRVLSVIFW